MLSQDDIVDDEPRDERHGKGQQGVEQDEACSQGTFPPVPPEKRQVAAQVLADAGLVTAFGNRIIRGLPRKPVFQVFKPGFHLLQVTLQGKPDFRSGAGHTSPSRMTCNARFVPGWMMQEEVRGAAARVPVTAGPARPRRSDRAAGWSKRPYLRDAAR